MFRFINYIIIFFLINCGSKSIDIEEDLLLRFNKAKIFFDTKKYSRAKDEFDYIIRIDPGSKISNESQYYKGEALFHLKEYDEAWVTLDRFVRFSNDIKKIELSRYRMCECAIFASNPYQRDQRETIKALNQLQLFIEDFPNSELLLKAEKSIIELRYKLAKKEFEVGRIYLKLDEYESALLYFKTVLNNYYDTNFADEARIGIIFTHILNDNRPGAINYLETEKDRFLSIGKLNEAESLIKETVDGLKMTHYYKLYK